LYGFGSVGVFEVRLLLDPRSTYIYSMGPRSVALIMFKISRCCRFL